MALVGLCSAGPATAAEACGRGAPVTAGESDLDVPAGAYGIFCDGTLATWSIDNVASPSLDGTALRVGLTGGQPFAKVHAYRTFPAVPDAARFVLDLSFMFQPATTCNNQGLDSVVQALEFTSSKWSGGKRWEAAVQYRNVGDGAPGWRYWDEHAPGNQWVALPVTQCLAANQWHHLRLTSSIVAGRVHYEELVVDAITHPLSIDTEPKDTPAWPDSLGFAAQLDGNKAATPFDLFLDKVSLVSYPSGNFSPLTPARILDTRDGTGGIAGHVGPATTVEVQVAGRGGVPVGAAAVAMNVTVTEPTASGFLTVYPRGSPQPLASNLNFTPGKTVPNLVVVRLGTGGQVSMFNSAGSTHVIFDVAGWFSDSVVTAEGRYQPLSPSRILDTRDGTGGGVRLSPGASFDLQASGRGGLPGAGAEAAILNVAVTGTTAASFLTVYPTGEPRPWAANLNFVAGDTVSNRVMAKLGSTGEVTIYNNSGSTDVVVDVGGWYTDASSFGTAGAYSPVVPARILDTRGDGAPVVGGTTVDVQVAGRGRVPPSGATAAILNVTVTEPAGPGYFTLFPAGTTRPLASDLNYAPGETRPNLVVVKLGAGGKISLFTPVTAHAVIDVAGWFA
jgi:hypothetical protein